MTSAEVAIICQQSLTCLLRLPTMEHPGVILWCGWSPFGFFVFRHGFARMSVLGLTNHQFSESFPGFFHHKNEEFKKGCVENHVILRHHKSHPIAYQGLSYWRVIESRKLKSDNTRITLNFLIILTRILPRSHDCKKSFVPLLLESKSPSSTYKFQCWSC